MIGLCPRPFTLRKLKWMSDGKKCHDYDLNIHLVDCIGDGIAGKLHPIRSNPYRQNITPVVKNKEQREYDSKMGFRMLGRYLRGISGKRR